MKINYALYLKKLNLLHKKNHYRKSNHIEIKLIKKIASKPLIRDELYFMHGKTLYYLKKYKESIFYLSKLLNSTDEDLLYEAHYYLYLNFYETSDYDNLIEFGLKACEYIGIPEATKAKIFSNVGRFNYMLHLSTNRMNYLYRALYYNTESQKILEKLNKTDTEDYFYTLYDCGDINFYLEDYDIAIDYYEKVEEKTSNPDLLFGIYTNLMEIYNEKGFRDTMLFYKRKMQTLN